MRTMSTDVKDKRIGDKRIAQGDATRGALIAAGRELFGERGYADTATDEVVARAGVTKGALYHHFTGKEDLFRAVLEQVQREVSDKAVAEFLRPDSWDALLDGCALWIDAHLDMSVRRIVLHDARAVLGADDVRAIENRFGAVALRGALRKAMTAGALERAPLRPLAVLLMGALSEGCLYIAGAEDGEAARTEVHALITKMLSAFRVPATPPKPVRRPRRS
jgi:AcrR family transcriptional regulator